MNDQTPAPGSSAAAAVGGVALADAALGLGLDPTTLLEIAAGIEGHPDNAAAAVFGGFTMVVDERVVARFDPDPELRPALFVTADITISTEDARRALPQTIPREDAVANAGHAALTAVALLHAHPRIVQPPQPFAQQRQLVIVRREQRTTLVDLMQVLDRRPRNGETIPGRGAAPNLIEDDDRIRRRLIEDRRGLDHLDHES